MSKPGVPGGLQSRIPAPRRSIWTGLTAPPQRMDYEEDSYAGTCAVCGNVGTFERRHRAIRETYRCSRCGSSLRERHQAQAILDTYGGARNRSLAGLVRRRGLARLRVYEPGTTGALRKHLSALPHYRQSDYYPPGSRDAAPDNIPHQDLEALTWPDGRFDLVVSSDILEHVRHPRVALMEISRVLARGGYHIFTVPLQEPLQPASIMRVDTSGEVDVPLLPEHYHGDGKGGKSLVYTDFGADLLDMIRATGMEARFAPGRSRSAIANRALTVVSWRPPGCRRHLTAVRALAARLGAAR
jgi:SAM-dependent methyltransferase